MNCIGGAFTHPNGSGTYASVDSIYGFYLEQNRAARAIQKAATVVYRGRTPLAHCCVGLRINLQPNATPSVQRAAPSESACLSSLRSARGALHRQAGKRPRARSSAALVEAATRTLSRAIYFAAPRGAPLSCSRTSSSVLGWGPTPEAHAHRNPTVSSARHPRGTVVHGAIYSGNPRTGARRVDASRRRRVELESQTPRRRRRA